jgi:hypothetical protein
MIGYHSHADPPRTLTERLEQLNDNLQSLGGRLKDAIANAVSAAVAGAIQDAVRNLLGASNRPELDPRFDRRGQPDNGIWDDPEQASWDEGQEFGPRSHDTPVERTPTCRRWRNALGSALQAGLWWMRRQPRRRPVLTTLALAVAAGVTAFIAGPTLAAGLGVVASAAGLLMTANAADSLSDRLRKLVTG